VVSNAPTVTKFAIATLSIRQSFSFTIVWYCTFHS